jgi:hypothetical protein
MDFLLASIFSFDGNRRERQDRGYLRILACCFLKIANACARLLRQCSGHRDDGLMAFGMPGMNLSRHRTEMEMPEKRAT